MRSDLVRADIFVDLGKTHVHGSAPSRSRDPGEGIDHNTGGTNDAVFQRREERQDRARRVASGIGDELCRGDRVPVELGEPVDCAGEEIRGRVLAPVVQLVELSGPETEISTQVDDPSDPLFQKRDDLHRFAGREGHERNVDAAQSRRDKLIVLEVALSRECRIEGIDPLPCGRGCGHLLYPYPGMGGEDPQELGPRVSRCPDNCCVHHGVSFCV